jgi:glycosyltransferase involved in cell wall biosynthesis
VVFSSHAYSPSIGGAERYAQGLAEGLAALGHEVYVVVPDVDDPEAFYELGHRGVGAAEATIGGVGVQRLPYAGLRYRILGRLLGAERVIRSATERFQRILGNRLSTLDPDVVVALPHLFPNVEEVIRLRAESRWKLIYVPMLHEDDPYWSIERVSGAVAAADAVVALTDHERERLLESYGAAPGLTAVIPPGVDFGGDNGSRSREPMVLFVGRRTASKRLDVLYEAMRTVWQEIPDVRLVLAGSPPGLGADPAIWMAADPRVKVINTPNDLDKDELMGRAQLVVSPSLTESFGITTLEAWAQGTPVVVADSPVNRAVVRHGTDGLVASGPDAADLADALSLMLGDAARTEQMGRAGRQRVEAEFSWPRSAAILDRLIDRL